MPSPLVSLARPGIRRRRTATLLHRPREIAGWAATRGGTDNPDVTALRTTVPRQSFAAVVAGVLATIPMSGVMLAADAAGRMGTQPPRRVVDEAVERAPGQRPSSTLRDVAATTLHFVLGGVMALGIVPFRLVLDRLVPGPVRDVLAGTAFGTSLYAVNYAGVAPALDILPPPTDDRPGRQWAMLAAHLVYGVALAILLRMLAPRGRRDVA
jgi:hypothetical protein